MPAHDDVWAHLPAALRAAVPELGVEVAGEARADCARCPMTSEAAPHPWAFSAEVRCCTAHPSLANWLVGRALRRPGPGRDALCARLTEPAGVDALGIDAPPALTARYRATVDVAFGRDATLRCPYWIGGEHSCGVWHDRSATCRAWFCKHERGLGGAVVWSRASFLVSDLEQRLARWCADGVGRAAPAPGAPLADWIGWFEACADRAAALDDAIAATLVAGVAPARTELVQIRGGVQARRRAPGDVLVPAVSEWTRVDGDVLLAGYSTFDAARAPGTIFELLSRLDGRPWRDALAAARAAVAADGGEPARLDDALVVALHRIGALRDPAGADDLPFAVELVGMERWTRAASGRGGGGGAP